MGFFFAMASSPVKDICYRGYQSIMPKTALLQNIMGEDNIALCSHLSLSALKVFIGTYAVPLDNLNIVKHFSVFLNTQAALTMYV